ncbi:MAG TPA: UDP-N-acetylmuramate--L-alanine ligase, partial [Candidatus Aerophobetes bacterium]|nr:UDP-N-acetylmuramate--L-alanine ligase [Candidatus Aerophobetes bacterium]
MHLHFVGIGGIGMSGLARIALNLGYRVSGSDLRENKLTDDLRKKGATIYTGHRANQLNNADAVIFSSAINKDNPEIRQAKIKGIPVISRGKLVADITNPHESIVVAGTHGKTTTTALICELLLEDKRNPIILIGGILKRIDSNSRWGNGGWAIIESDESDGSFLFHHPSIAVVTNVENDHLEYYSSRANILQAFYQFLKKIKSNGVGLVNMDDDGLRYILKKGGIKRN